MRLPNDRICRNPFVPMSAWRLSLRVCPTRTIELLTHLMEQRLHLVPLAAHPRVELPLFDGSRAIQHLVERVVDPEQLVSGEVHLPTVGDEALATRESRSRGRSVTAPDLRLALWRAVIPEGSADEDGRYFESVLVARPGYYG